MTNDKKPADVLVAIPVLNEAARIAHVLAELACDLPPDRRTRFLVLDGGSHDATRALVLQMADADARISLVPNPNRLQSAALNLAARLALPDETILIRADAHTTYPPGFVADVARALDRDDVDSVVVAMDSAGSTCFGKATAWVSDTRLGSGGSAHRGGHDSKFVDHGHHAGWTFAAFRAAGGYDERFSHNEDAELDCRLNRLGLQVWLDADIRLTYFVRSNPIALFRQYRNYGRGRSRTVRRHPGSIRLRQLAVPSAILAMAACLLAAPVAPLALALPAIYGAALAATSIQVALKHRSACGLLAGLAALTMHVAWTIGFLGGMLMLREQKWQGETKQLLLASTAR